MLPTMSASHHLQSTAGGSRLSRTSAAATGCAAPPAASPAVPPAASSAALIADDSCGVGAVPAVAAAPSADACSPRERSFSPRGKRAAECRRAPRHRHSRSFSGDLPTFHAIAPRSPAHSAIPASNSPLSRRPREDPVETAAYPGDGTCSPASPAPGGEFSAQSGDTANGARLSAQRWSLPPGTSVDGGVGMGDCPLTGGLSGSGPGSSGGADVAFLTSQSPRIDLLRRLKMEAAVAASSCDSPSFFSPSHAAASTGARDSFFLFERQGSIGLLSDGSYDLGDDGSGSFFLPPVDDGPAAAFLEASYNPAEPLTDATSSAPEPLHSTSGAARATVVSRAIATARFATSTSTGSSSGSHVSNSTWTTAVTNLSHESSSSERASSRLSSGLDGGIDGAFDVGNGSGNGGYVQESSNGFGGDTWTGAELSSAESSPRLSPSSPGFFSPSRRSFSHQQDPFQHNSLQGLLLDAEDDDVGNDADGIEIGAVDWHHSHRFYSEYQQPQHYSRQQQQQPPRGRYGVRLGAVQVQGTRNRVQHWQGRKSTEEEQEQEHEEDGEQVDEEEVEEEIEQDEREKEEQQLRVVSHSSRDGSFRTEEQQQQLQAAGGEEFLISEAPTAGSTEEIEAELTAAAAAAGTRVFARTRKYRERASGVVFIPPSPRERALEETRAPDSPRERALARTRKLRNGTSGLVFIPVSDPFASAEEKRCGGEGKRCGGEGKRCGAEEKRRGAEEKRRGAEEKRRGAEEKRRGAEEKRRGAEEKRRGAEEKRRGAEEKRCGAEGRSSQSHGARTCFCHAERTRCCHGGGAEGRRTGCVCRCGMRTCRVQTTRPLDF
ncbi:unnamed protein product [Closterium sp. Naga37s-1]|nr:unnamed protein product [Closterium sp. Naga37s-1]